VAIARRVGHRAFLNNALFNALGSGLHLGEWQWATPVLGELVDPDLELVDRALGAAIVVAYRTLRGEPSTDLATMIRQMDSTEPAVRQVMTTFEAYFAISEGRERDAVRLFEQDEFGGAAFDNLSWATHLAAWSRDEESLRRIAAGLHDSGQHGATVEALDLLLRADLAAVAGSGPDAVALYRRAIDAWGELGLRFQEALTGIDMATLLDPADLDVQRAIQDSRVILSELGAIPLLERLASVVARIADDPGTPTAEPVPVSEGEVAST
jgi:hypothetical protein